MSSRISSKGKENLSSSISAFISYSPDDSFSSQLSNHHEEETSTFDSSTKSLPALKTNSHRLPTNSSSSYSSTPEEETSFHSNKEILGPTNNTLDLPDKNITERTSGTCKTFSSTHLGTYICSKSKVRASKYLKSFHKTMSTKTLSSTYFS